jgi:drug/metabolite transporter (DMT)-like permease
MTWALVATVAAAFMYGLGAVLQSIAARRGGAGVGVSGLSKIVRQGPYIAGLVCDLVGWLMAMYAVNKLPLFAVHSTLAGSVAVTVVLARVFLHTPLRLSDGVAIAATLVGLVLVGLAAGPAPDDRGSTTVRFALALGLVVAGIAGVVGVRSKRPIRVAAIAGVLFSIGATTVRTIDVELSFGEMMKQPMVLVAAAYLLVGLVVHAHSLRIGNVGLVTASLWATEVVAAAFAGYALFGDRVRSGLLWLALVGMAIALGATIRLALSPSHAETAAPAGHP